MAVCVERRGGAAGGFLAEPVAGGAESGEEKAAEDDFLKERRKGDGEGEKEPGRHAGVKELFDGGVFGAGEEQFVDHGEDETGAGGGHEGPEAAQGCRGVPLQAGEESLVPEEGKDEQGGGEGDEILDGHAAQCVVDVGFGLLDGGDAEEMKIEGGTGDETDAEQAEEGQDGKEQEMAEMGDAGRGWADFGRVEGLEKEGLGGFSWYGRGLIGKGRRW